MPADPHILFAGGGSVGQLFPGLSVAAQLAWKMPEAAISFAGPGSSCQRQMVRTAGYNYLNIPSKPAPHNPLQAVRFFTDNLAGYCAARWILREQHVSMVVGLGGHTSAAIVRAAVARGTPIILLEQNAIPGRTTRWLSRWSALVCAAFEETRSHLHVQTPVTVTGSPVAPAFEQFYRREQQKGQHLQAPSETSAADPKKRLVVLGGMGGAPSLNQSMPSALKQLGDAVSDWHVIHQTGDGQLRETEECYRKLGVDALAVTYIDEIAPVLCASDLVVSRAGGTTLAELALAGVPALLVPSPEAADDHQLANAKVFSSTGACRMIDETAQEGALDKAVSLELMTLLTHQDLRQQLASQIKQLARPQASADVAAMIRDTFYGVCSRERLAA